MFARIGAIRNSRVGRTLVVGGLDVPLVRPVTDLLLAYKAEARENTGSLRGLRRCTRRRESGVQPHSCRFTADYWPAGRTV